MIDKDSHAKRSAISTFWRKFWFAPEPAYPLGLVRITFGALVVAWTVSLLPDLEDLFGDQGVLPRQPTHDYVWGVLGLASSVQVLLIGWVALLVSALALTLGWHSRIAALAVFVLIHSFEQRSPFVFNSGDGLIRIVALVLALSSCGAALSLDRRRASGSFWSAELRAPWAIRLLQVQLSLVYLSTVNAKLEGNAWSEGTAVSYALRYEDMLIVRTPNWLTTNALLMNVATWGTLALELAIGILVWVKPLRRWVLGAGLLMHLMIMVTIGVGFFTPAMFVLYLAFVPPDTVRRLPTTIRRRVAAAAILRRHRLDDRVPPKRIEPTADPIPESVG
jgi:vitamin K-dependent gamma-carboxylase-like protein